MRKSAILSACGLYRYELRREWDDALRPMVVGMLNPSTADAEKDDPTIRRVVGFARREGCGSVVVWNLGAGRSPSPAAWASMPDPVGPRNFGHVRRLLEEGQRRGALFVAAWGARAPTHLTVDYSLMFDELGVKMWCLGRTASWHPRHPLYVPGNAPLVPLYKNGETL